MSDTSHQHKPAVYPDGAVVKFRVPRVGGSSSDQPSLRRSDRPIAAIFLLCHECGALYADADELRDWKPARGQNV